MQAALTEVAKDAVLALVTNTENLLEKTLAELGESAVQQAILNIASYYTPLVGQIVLAVKVSSTLLEVSTALYDFATAAWLETFSLKDIVMQANNQKPTVTIDASVTEGLSPLEVSFSSMAVDADGEVVSYSWQFGDGTTSAGINPVHTFTSAGSYTVTLVVTDDDGAESDPASITITVTTDVFPGVAPAMAVVTGDYDRMEDLLAKLGFGEVDETGRLVAGTEGFALYDGNGTLSESYKDADLLFTDVNELKKYGIIFINCGTWFESLLTDTDMEANLRTYVEDGGRLYVTDLSYDYIEQAFPSFVDFYGSDATPATEPEAIDAAQVGVEGITTNASVLDAVLSDWLNLRGALNPDGTVHIEGFLIGWALINNVSSATKVWTEGEVSWYTDEDLTKVRAHGHETTARSKKFASDPGVRPLTVTFSYGSGKVLYSSYHTIPEFSTTTLSPQEKILQNLVFEFVSTAKR